MGFLSGLGDLVKQYSSGQGGASAEQLVSAAPPSCIASSLAEVFRSSETAPFAQQASQLFASSNGPQRASVLNTLLATAGPAVLARLGSGSSLASLLGNNRGTVTPEQAAAVKPEEVQALGAAALAMAASHIANNHQG